MGCNVKKISYFVPSVLIFTSHYSNLLLHVVCSITKRQPTYNFALRLCSVSWGTSYVQKTLTKTLIFETTLLAMGMTMLPQQSSCHGGPNAEFYHPGFIDGGILTPGIWNILEKLSFDHDGDDYCSLFTAVRFRNNWPEATWKHSGDSSSFGRLLGAIH